MRERRPCSSSPSEGSPSTKEMPEDVLATLAALLGVNFVQEDDNESPKFCNNCAVDWDSILWEPCIVNTHDDSDVDFSSFPSLSLDRSQEEELLEPSPRHGSRRAVEAHVSSLLSRPILVTSASKDFFIAEDDEEGETMDIVADKVSEVPGLMLQNFYRSFTTLMNSRLRAYATFLARHGLTLLETSTTPDFEEGVVGVEQKIETMLEIGRLASTNAIVTSFRASKEGAKRSVTTDEETSEVTMPLTMDAAIDISLPRPWGGQSEVVTVAFQTVGTITGIFSQASGNSLLRVVGVDLDMTKLLSCMMDQAASVISSIVEMTNAIYSLSLPASLDEAQSVTLHCGRTNALPRESSNHKRKSSSMSETAAVVSPSLGPTASPPAEAQLEHLHELYLDQEEIKGCIELTAENCEQLVDVVLHEAPESVLSPPTRKKIKVVVDEEVRALPSTGIASQ